VLESVADFLISSIPFYFLIKVAFLVYLFLPQTQGAKVIYENVIRTHIVPHLGINSPSGKKSD
jgi:receptor expression-enhancing protein 5/6